MAVYDFNEYQNKTTLYKVYIIYDKFHFSLFWLLFIFIHIRFLHSLGFLKNCKTFLFFSLFPKTVEVSSKKKTHIFRSFRRE